MHDERLEGTTEVVKAEGSQVVDQTQRDAEDVVRHTGERAGEVLETARHEVRSVFEDATGALRHEADERSKEAGAALHSLGRDLHRMSERSETDGVRPPVADYVEAIAGSVDRMADTLEHGSSSVLDSVRTMAERRPGAFVAGSAMAGFALGRLLRNSEMPHTNGNGSGNGSSQLTGSHPTTTHTTDTAAGDETPAYAHADTTSIPPPPPPGAPPPTGVPPEVVS